MDRPDDLFDREREWHDLVAFATSRGPGTRLAIVRGRRRQGKSFLLRRLAAASGGFYYQAVTEERVQALSSLGAALGAHLGVPGGRLAFASWDDALEALSSIPGSRAPLVVIDEFPYLLAHSPELPSVLQRFIDRSRDGGPTLRLVLCGSALTVMAQLLAGPQALRGRASHDLVIDAFDYRTAAQYWDIDDPTTAFRVHAVLGGTPGYRDLLTHHRPTRVRDFDAWLAAGPLDPASALFRETDYLLAEEPTITDRALYHSVLAAIADGHHTQSGIAAALGRSQVAVQHPLRALEEVGFIIRRDDQLRSRRPLYSIADPIVRFHHVVTRRDIARFEDRRTELAWTDAQPRFSTHVLGPHFEQLAREFSFRFASANTLGGTAATVGPAVVNDAKKRAQHELDVVVLGREPHGASRVLALGEAKHTTARRTLHDLDRLDHIRTIVAAKHPTAADAKVLLFSATGFDAPLRRKAAERGDIELVDLDRIYRGD
jgi:AAA+ ATPase superfamily predicted ATPase